MTLYKVGDSIAGEKIFFRFGNYSCSTGRGGRRVGTLAHRGYARVDKPLKRATTVVPRERESIDCLAASYACDDFSVSGKKITLKSHTGFEGFLKGDAECEIKLPHPNHPQ